MDVLKEHRQLQPMYACDGATAETFENWLYVINQKKVHGREEREV